jgi:hypothetical protein
MTGAAVISSSMPLPQSLLHLRSYGNMNSPMDILAICAAGAEARMNRVDEKIAVVIGGTQRLRAAIALKWPKRVQQA